MPTLEDVARKAGVSRVTASRVLNGTYKNKVSDETRRRVLQVVEEMNYHSSIPARALRSKRTMEFGLLIPDLAFSFLPEVVQGLQDVATDMDYGCLVYLSHNQPQQEERSLRTIMARRVDGLIWLPTENPTADSLAMAQSLPTVQLLHKSGGAAVPAVLINQEMGGYLAAKFLLELGHTRITFVLFDHPHSKQREVGYRKALSEAGITPDESFLEHVPDTTWDAGLIAARRIFTRAIRPTAIIASSDAGAWGTLKAAKEVGLQTPTDISIVGFGNVAISKQVEVPLTTIDHPKREVGRAAMRMLAALLSGEPAEDTILPVCLVERHSTGRPPV